MVMRNGDLRNPTYRIIPTVTAAKAAATAIAAKANWRGEPSRLTEKSTSKVGTYSKTVSQNTAIASSGARVDSGDAVGVVGIGARNCLKTLQIEIERNRDSRHVAVAAFRNSGVPQREKRP
jgi:hypothetical protein